MKWSERQIASRLARITFDRKHLLIVPNCQWPGSECDLLVVTPNLRVIDVEIKISRADLKADAAKDKWFHAWDWKIDGPWGSGKPRRRREFPRNVWKHYYCMPQEIWRPELLASMSTVSGVLLIHENRHDSNDFSITCERAAKPNRAAGTIDAEDAIDIARLASLRMWDAFSAVDELRKRHVAQPNLNGRTECRAT